MAELRAMPVTLLNAWAVLFNAIETTGRWPKALLTALVTLIPKGGERTPLNHRPTRACARLRDITAWQEKWIDDSQHGFRPKRDRQYPHGTQHANGRGDIDGHTSEWHCAGFCQVLR
eukprot:TRINITY_DN8334_c0_g1_i2.p2 TRINITY_DN8334_c0_g1~~TRINITY_DN8334_c0_g1_i2.p2  ORF type:complete len:117 (+),score=11.52 TRINITY_DN8334_c0_g1_i2:1615-1965(+)